MDVDAYLKRIQYVGSREPTIETLRHLCLNHLYTVPFENLDILPLRKPILLDQHVFFEKIVRHRRGGFCYELNGLFSQLLKELGYNVTMFSARAANDHGNFGHEFDHMTLLVELDERWLVDVGFGDSFREPLLLDYQKEQIQFNRAYRISENDGIWRLEEKKDGLDWKDQYIFTLIPHELSEYEGMCLYHQLSPESSFTQKKICTRATPFGRITLSDIRFITTMNKKRKEELLVSEDEFRNALRLYFGIELSS